MRRFPIHGHTDSGAAGGMIEKDEFLKWRRIEFAISAEFERHLCHAIRLARCVDSESVCFSFGDAYHCVEKRRGDENQCAEYQNEQRKPGWVGNAAHAPFVAVPSHGGVEKHTSERESDEDENSKVSQQFCAVIKNVMAHNC